jgi:hypothetical protein
MSPHSDSNATAAWEDEGVRYFEVCMSFCPNLQRHKMPQARHDLISTVIGPPAETIQ